MSQFSLESFCLPVQVHHILPFLISLQNSQTEAPLGCCIRLRCRSLNFYWNRLHLCQRRQQHSQSKFNFTTGALSHQLMLKFNNSTHVVFDRPVQYKHRHPPEKPTTCRYHFLKQGMETCTRWDPVTHTYYCSSLFSVSFDGVLCCATLEAMLFFAAYCHIKPTEVGKFKL